MKQNLSKFRALSGFFLLVLCEAITSCRVFNTSAGLQEILPPSTESPLVQFSDPGPNLPPIGRSLFDQLIGRDPIPFPFEELVKTLNKSAEGYALTSALIPRGRSLQKEAAKPNYFDSPRIILTHRSWPVRTQMSLSIYVLVLGRLIFSIV